jgi:hypothetical protein
MMTTICDIKLEKTILGGILHLLYCGPFTPLMSTAPVIPAQQKNPFSDGLLLLAFEQSVR